jgi:CRP-like cAMP-binding protein
MIGREGVTGAGGAFGAAQHVYAMMCQGDGQAHQIDVGVLRDLVQQSPSIATVMGRYLHCLTLQIGQTAYANASMNIEARLARWVLMTDDRTDGYELSLTHEFMAAMLGARRPGVTTAIHVLEGARMIRAERGVITVTDRGKLEDLASDAYGLAEAEYERLFA